MDRYEVLLFLHVVGAVVWIGIGLTVHVLLFWADRTREREFAARLAAAVEWIEPRAVVAGPLLLLGTGIGMVVDGPWGFGDSWIVAGLAGYASAAVLGAGFEGPEARRLGEIIRERGPDDREVIARTRRLNGLGWVELAILVVVVLSMTTKPAGAGTAGFWAVVAAILVGAGVLVVRAYRRAFADLPEVVQVAPPA